MNRIGSQFASIEQAAGEYFKGKPLPKTQNEKTSETLFEDILNYKRLKFSKHANDRLQSRNINLSGQQLERLHEGVEKAREKNIKESLVIVDEMSFIVNVNNNVVVTAMGKDEEQKIFTNIDGAVIS